MFIAYRMYVKTCNFANTPLLLSKKLRLYAHSLYALTRIDTSISWSGRANSTVRIFERTGSFVTCFRSRSTVSWRNETGGMESVRVRREQSGHSVARAPATSASPLFLRCTCSSLLSSLHTDHVPVRYHVHVNTIESVNEIAHDWFDAAACRT